MRAGRNPRTGETEIYLTDEEAKCMREMVEGTSLPLRRVFYQLLREI